MPEPLAILCRSESEKNRRRDLAAALGLRKENMQQTLKRDQRSANRYASTRQRGGLTTSQGLLASDQLGCCRSNLLEPSTSSASPARETHATAGLDNRELLQMQQHVMDDQDAELAELEKTVNSTKVMSVFPTQLRLRCIICHNAASRHTSLTCCCWCGLQMKFRGTTWAQASTDPMHLC